MIRVTGYRTYHTREGDTFDALALEMYGDETLSHYIIQFNPDHADVIVFEAGALIRLPIVENAELPESLPPWRRGDSV